MPPPALPTPPISPRRRLAITGGLLLGMSLGALEATVVATAMPTVAATLGGLAHFSWVFSAYLLSSTASVPIWGRLSDLYGRRRMYLTAVVIFLIGSALCGLATDLYQLIAYRLIQGIGAGGIIPLSMTIVGELYTLKERPRAQALFSGVWGLASIAGPIVGGYITDYAHWRWVFFLNIPFGIMCMAVIASAYPASRVVRKVEIDWLGAGLFFFGISAILLALGGDTGHSALWVLLSVFLLGGFVLTERRSAEPMLPFALLRTPLVARTFVVVFLVGFALFGAISFIPLWVQAVGGGTATDAGQVLTPLFLGWVVMSVVGARMTVKVGYRVSSISGSVLMTIGFVGLLYLTPDSPRTLMLWSCLLVGAGMGTQMLSLLLAVQHGVGRSQLGIATALNQFSRSIGAAVGVAAMGAILARSLVGVPMPEGADGLAASGAMALSGPVRAQFATALHRVFLSGAIVSVAGLIATFFLPPVDFSKRTDRAAGEELLEAEMTTLQPKDEPVVVGD